MKRICQDKNRNRFVQVDRIYRNRRDIHRDAPKSSGGVGILVKQWVCDTYNISLIGKTVDGILGVKFVHKETDSDVVVFSCYLPPENSTRGRDAQTFFAHLLAQMYLQCDCDNTIILEDFNAHIGPMSDTVYDCDSIPERTIIDKSINQHGHEFIEFLTESKCCVLNGRFDNCDDNFTSVSRCGLHLCTA